METQLQARQEALCRPEHRQWGELDRSDAENVPVRSGPRYGDPAEPKGPARGKPLNSLVHPSK
jgi:hypothetical protein